MGAEGPQGVPPAAAEDDEGGLPDRRRSLEAARALKAEMPTATAVKYGNLEGMEWWERHEGLLEDARLEYGPRNSEIYHLAPLLQLTSPSAGRAEQLGSATWLQDGVRRALADGSSKALRSVLQEVCRDSAGYAVYTLDLFTEEFCDMLLAELDHLEASGIPLRRPNGMNRYGAILSQLGFQEGLLQPLMKLVAAPLAQELWPEWVGDKDCGETYGFVVRYRIGEDVDLAEHADTANVTLNACLGRAFEGGELYFKGVRFTDSADDKEEHTVCHKKGVAILHLGGHFHGVRPLRGGERSNLVLWATGDGGVVRIRPSTPSRKPICGLA